MEDIFNDDMDINEIIDFGFPRRVNVRRNYFEEMDNLTFFKRFRLYKETVIFLLDIIEQNLEFVNDRNYSVSPINQLLCCLRFYASSGHLSSVADFMGIDIATASRIIAKVSRELASLYPQFVKLPTARELVREQENFYNMFQFPRIIGVVDGTHVKIQSPGGNDAEVFRNRKSYFSVNVQVVGNADMKFTDVVARWPGSTHDATIFANSRLRARFEAREFQNTILIGDNGYGLRDYFLTPLAAPVTRGQQMYNESLIRTRNLIEHLVGVTGGII